MALKRLDEEFELKPGTQLLPYMKRLLPSLEGRFQSVESEQDIVNKLAEEIRAAALMRMNEILIPATEDIIAVTKLGFLLGPCSETRTLQLGYYTMFIDEGPQRNSFTPSPYVIVEHSIDDYAIARVIGYHQSDGLLELMITAIHGNPGPHSTWVVSSTPGMADSTKIYHDAVAPMHDEVVASMDEIRIKHQEIMDAAEALEESGLDVYAFIRRDGSVPFIAPQMAMHPVTSSNDQTIPTTAWSRARMQEYVGQAMQRTGDTMTGFLTLSANPVNPLHAATKAYVDSIIGAGGTMQGVLTIRTAHPSVRLYPTGTTQNRMIEALGSNAAARWIMVLADTATESGGNAGSNFGLNRYSDTGTYLGTAFSVNRANGNAAFSGTLNVGGLLTVVAGGATITGSLTNAGDMHAHRGNDTGVLYLGNARSAHVYWDGATYQLSRGGLSVNSGTGPIAAGHLNCYSLSTNGHGATVWGLTSHGAATINGGLTVNSNMKLAGGQGYNDIEFWDSDWGSMWIHHNGDLIGYLNNGRGWIHYITNAGHMWTAQYGWLHDYVNGQANSYAWSAANSRWNDAVNSFATHGTANNLQAQLNQHWGRMDSMQGGINAVQGAITSTRLAHAGDPGSMDGGLQVWEPYAGSVVTGWGGYNNIIWYFRCRYLQVAIGGNWYTTGYA